MLRQIRLATVALVLSLSGLPLLHLRAEEPDDRPAATVIVRSRADHKPIQGATVWSYAWREESWLERGGLWVPQGSPRFTNEEGFADLLVSPSRTAHRAVVASARGFRMTRTWVNRPQEYLDLPPADPVMGVVVEEGTLRPVPNVIVRSYIPLDGMCDMLGHDHVSGVGPVRDVAETDATGRFYLEDGGVSRLLSVECPGFATTWRGVRLSETVTAVKFKLGKSCHVDGIVVNAEGRPVAGATVVAHASTVKQVLHPSAAWIQGASSHMFSEDPLWSAECPTTTTTGADGRFRLSALTRDVLYWIWSKHGDSFGLVDCVTSATDASAGPVKVVLAPFASVVVKVSSGRGTPVADCRVTVRRVGDGPRWGRTVHTDADGIVQLGPLIPGRYRVHVNDLPVVTELDLVQPGEEVTLRLR